MKDDSLPHQFIVSDPVKCTGCMICAVECALAKYGVLNPKKGSLRVFRKKLGFDYTVSCRHCENPECLPACPEEAIYEKDGLVLINENQCVNCLVCVDACPYEAIFVHPDLDLPIRCDLCLGRAPYPICIASCPVQALQLGSEELHDKLHSQEIALVKQFLAFGGNHP